MWRAKRLAKAPKESVAKKQRGTTQSPHVWVMPKFIETTDA